VCNFSFSSFAFQLSNKSSWVYLYHPKTLLYPSHFFKKILSKIHLQLSSLLIYFTNQTIAEKLTSSEFRGFIKNTKLNYSQLAELKTTLFALQAVLVDAEQKQFNDLPVKQWLDDLKDAIFDAEYLLDLISYHVLRSVVEKTPVDQLQNLPSIIKINSKMEKMCKRLQTFVQLKDTLGLQRTVSARVSSITPSSSVLDESVIVLFTMMQKLNKILISKPGFVYLRILMLLE